MLLFNNNMRESVFPGKGFLLTFSMTLKTNGMKLSSLDVNPPGGYSRRLPVAIKQLCKSSAKSDLSNRKVSLNIECVWYITHNARVSVLFRVFYGQWTGNR